MPATDVASFFTLIGFIIIVGWLGTLFFKRTGIPEIPFLVLLGVLAGPVFNLVDREGIIAIAPILAALAITVILFDGGLNLNIYKVVQESPRATVLAILSVVTGMVVSTLFGIYVLRWEFLPSLFFGAVVSGTSSAVVIPLVTRIGVSQKVSTLLSLESAFTDAIVVVLSVTILQLVLSGIDGGSGIEIARGIASGFSIGAVLGFFGGIMWLRVLRSLPHETYDDILTLTIVLLLYGISESVGGSGAISALLFGLVLGNGIEISRMLRISEPVQASTIMRKFQSQISFLLRTFFFTYLGIIFTLGNLNLLLFGAGVTLLILVSRYLAVRLATLKDPILGIDRGIMTVMLPRGLAAAAVSQLPATFGLNFPPELQDIVVAVIIISVLVSTVGAYLPKITSMRARSRASRRD